LSRVRAALFENPLVVDGAVALGLTALSLLALAAGAPDLGASGPLNLTLLLLQTAPLVLRRRYPAAVLVVIFGALAGQILILPEHGDLSATFGPLVALYTVGEQLDRRAGGSVVLLAGAVTAGLMVWHRGLPAGLQALIQTELLFFIAWFVGDAVRTRRLYLRALEDRARLLERERAEQGRRAVLEERERIARELHDAVTHHVSVIVIQAAGALRALDRRREEARSALTAIEDTGRKALTDMRRMLGVLGDAPMPDPPPGLDGLDDLLEQVRAAGLAVDLSMLGHRRQLDPGLELSAYRIIQEGLTNTLKHAGGGRAHVSVTFGPRSLDITIDDERGPRPAVSVEPAHDGRGLVGMRERVAMFRGTFTANPTATGFHVQAQLPLDGSAAPS
jgi:signal transduction histidine kinase